MSGVHATQASPLDAIDPTTRYLDTLYDIMATGVEPGDCVALTDIETFLHQHARRPKTLAEFREFFGRHRLGLRSEEPGGVPRILEPLPPMTPLPTELTSPRLPDEDGDPTSPGALSAPLAVATPATRHRGAIVAALTVLVLVGVAGAWGFLTLTQLRAELAAARAQGSENREAIRQLDQQADLIRDDVQETGRSVRRFEEKHDMLLEALLPAPAERP